MGKTGSYTLSQVTMPKTDSTSTTPYVESSINRECGDKWYHVIGVYDGSNINIYINGKLRNGTTSGIPSPPVDNNEAFNIGKTGYTASTYSGKIDEPFITTTVITEADALRMFRNGCLVMGGTPGDGTCDNIPAQHPNNKIFGTSNAYSAVWALPDGSRLYVGTSGAGGVLSVIDAASNTLISYLNSVTNSALISNDVVNLTMVNPHQTAPWATCWFKHCRSDDSL